VDRLTQRRLSEAFPVFEQIDDSERRLLMEEGCDLLTVPGDTTLFEQGQACQGFPLLLSGCVRVTRSSSAGRSLELYRLGAGELCVVSCASLFGRAPMTADGHAVGLTELVMLSPAAFDGWCTDEPFRRLVISSLADRLSDLMALVEAVAFQRLDQRLAAVLVTRGPILQMSHQDLADELGTVREMVSRVLNRFQAAGWLRLARERIEVLDTTQLRLAAQGDSEDAGIDPSA
jgi:CRP/FNR family transcriptional regulator, anaerobic regulatory protein